MSPTVSTAGLAESASAGTPAGSASSAASVEGGSAGCAASVDGGAGAGAGAAGASATVPLWAAAVSGSAHGLRVRCVGERVRVQGKITRKSTRLLTHHSSDIHAQHTRSHVTRAYLFPGCLFA